MSIVLSVITINLNNDKGLEKTLNSLVNQTFSDYELIIIDGGSSDESIRVIEEFEGVFSARFAYKLPSTIPFSWISEPDNGIYHAMNKGIKRAKGDYCFFLNSGDYLVSENTFTEVFENNPSEDIIFGNLLVCIDNKITGKIKGKNEISFMDLYKSNVVKHQSSFIRRRLFETYGLYDESLKIVADWHFFLKTIGFHNATYRYVDVDIAYFDNNGISNNAGDITMQERHNVLSTVIPPAILLDYQYFDKLMYLKPALDSKIPRLLIYLVTKFARAYMKWFVTK